MPGANEMPQSNRRIPVSIIRPATIPTAATLLMWPVVSFLDTTNGTTRLLKTPRPRVR